MSAPALQEQQQALLATLFGPLSAATSDRLPDLLDARNTQTTRGLQAYRANGHALAERTLLTAYPVIAALLGPDNTAGLARELWHRHPPHRGDLAQWGGALPDFLQTSPQLADDPWLPDVARAEWALHVAAGAADAPPDPASFARLATEEPQGLALTLAPGTAIVRSRYPVVSLIAAHTETTTTLEAAAQRLREGIAEHALIWRQGHRPRIATASRAALALVEQLLRGADLPDALDAATDPEQADPVGFDFSAWLAAAVTDGLVIGVHGLPSHTPTLETST